MYTLIFGIGVLLLICLGLFVSKYFEERFGQPILQSSGCAGTYLGGALILISVFLALEDPTMAPVADKIHDVLTFDTEDITSGLMYLGGIFFAGGWYANVRISNKAWGTFVSFSQGVIGAGTFALVVLLVILFFTFKGSKK